MTIHLQTNMLDSLRYSWNCFNFPNIFLIVAQCPRFKTFRKISCHWALFTSWAFEFKLHLILHGVDFIKRGLLFYMADFHGWNWRIPFPGFDENKTQHWALFSTKTNRCRFYFYWAKLSKSSLRSCSCQSRDISCRQSWV